MSILQKLKARDPRAGYAHDFVGVIKRGAREIVERDVKVVTNAGGMNPAGCKDAVAAALQAAGYGGKIKIGVVTGDDIMPQLDQMLERGITIHQHGHRRAAEFHPVERAERQRLFWRIPNC